jgi:hypothetical protein
MKTKSLLLILVMTSIVFLSHAQDKKVSDFDKFCNIKPDGWECQIIKDNFDINDIPRNAATPLAIVKYNNPNREFDGCGIGETNLIPSLILDFYPINRKQELLKLIKSQRYYSHCIPIYYGETEDYFIITSPCFKNNGTFTEEANSMIEDLYKALDSIIIKRDYYLNQNSLFDKN